MMDFGRGQHFSDYAAKRGADWDVGKKYMRVKYDEQQDAQRELGLRSRFGCFDMNKVCPV